MADLSKLIPLILVLIMISGAASYETLDVLVVRDGHTLVGDELETPDDRLLSRYEDAVNTVPDTDVSVYDVEQGKLGPSAQEMSEHDMVIWYTLGDHSGIANLEEALQTEDRENVTEYLEQRNGRVFLTGHNLHRDLEGSSFLRDTFRTMLHDPGVSAEYDLCEWDYSIGQGLHLECAGDEQDASEDVLYNEDEDNPNVAYSSRGTPLASSDMAFYQDDDIQLPGQRAIIMDVCNNRYSDDSLSDCKDAADDMINLRDDPDFNWYMDDSDQGSFEPDEIAGGMTYSYTQDYKTIFSTIGFEAVVGQDNRENLMQNSIDYLAGPRTYRTFFTSYQDDIAGTAVDESRYVNESVYFEARCRNTQRSQSGTDVDMMEYANSSSSLQDRSSYSGSGNMDDAFYIDDDDDGFNDAAFGYKETSFSLDSPPPGGINMTGGIHCRDSQSKGYWGKFQREWFKVDQVAPFSPLKLEPGKKYVNSGDAEFNVSYVDRNDDGQQITEDREGYRYDLVRFRCEGGDWGSWREYNDSRLYETYDYNASSGACSMTGNQTIKVQGRDYAGNFDSTNEMYVVVDRESPDFDATPGDRDKEVLITEETEINVTAEDNRAISYGVNGPENIYDNQTETSVFEPFQSFDPGFSEGENQLDVYLYDRAGNLNSSSFDYYVDISPPEIQSADPSNDSFIRTDEKIDLSIEEDQKFDNITVETASGNISSFDSTSTSIDPGWTSSGERWIAFWLHDVAGNTALFNYTYFVDANPPDIQGGNPVDGSFINNKTLLEYSFSDDETEVKNALADNGTRNFSIVSDETFDPSFSEEGSASIDLFINDSADNKIKQTFGYTVDLTPPNVVTNHTDTSWQNSPVRVAINATDNYETDYIEYGISDAGSSPVLDSLSAEGENVTLTVGCSSTCRKTVDYRANDSAGLLSSSAPDSSPAIKIDVEKPDAKIISPSDGSMESGTVNFEVFTNDTGVGLESASYNISSASDGQQFKNGSLSSGKNEFSWDSSNENGIFYLNITTFDSFSQSRNVSIKMNIDNQDVTTQVRDPSEPYVNRSFPVLLEAENPSDTGELVYHNYTVENDTHLLDSGNFTPTGSTNSITDVNKTDLPDGNLTITSYASSDSNTTKDSYELRLDTERPEVSINSPGEDTWQTGEIQIDYLALDSVSNRSFSYEISGSGDDYGTLEPGDRSFDLSTSICEDNSDSSCELRIRGLDRSGNNNSDTVSFNVDNTDPLTEFLSPSEGSWQNGEFSVERNDSDNVAENLQCSWTNGTESFISTCNTDFQVNLSVCGQQGSGECRIDMTVENPAGLTDSTSRRFSIDYTPPEIISSRFSNGELINDSQKLSFSVEDEHSGLDTLEVNTGDGWQSVGSGELFDPGWTTSGEKTVDIRANDIADNTRETSYIYTVDADKPDIKNFDITASGTDTRRIYPGDTAVFTLNATDFSKIEKRRLMLSGPDKDTELRFLSGNRTQFSVSELGNYSLEWIFLKDRAGNTRNISNYEGFTGIDISSDITFNGGQNTVATSKGIFNISVDFNRSSGGVANIDIPEYSEDGIQEFSIENESCVNCTYSEGQIQSDSRYASLRFNSTVPTPSEDRTENITVSTMYDPVSRNPLKVRPPVLDLENDRDFISIGQFESLEISGSVENLGNGTARNVSINAFSGELDYTNSTGKEDLNTGSLRSFSFRENFTSAGNYSVTVLAHDENSYYENSTDIEIQINDTEEPELERTSVSDQVIQLDSRSNFTASISDNTGVENVTVEMDTPQGNFNLTMARAQGEWFLNYTDTPDTGYYNFTAIYANDSRDNMAAVDIDSWFEVVDTKIDTAVTDFDVPNATLEAEVIDNASRVSGMKVNITKPRGAREVVDMEKTDQGYAVNYTNLSRSGDYTLNFTANTDEPVEKSIKENAPYGDALTGYDEEEITLSVDASPYSLEWLVQAVDGDARDVEVEFFPENSTVFKQSSSTAISVGDVYYESVYSFMEQFEAEKIGQTQMAIQTEDSTGDRINRTVNVTVTGDDNKVPDINGVNLSETRPNTEEEFTVTANVTDNTMLDQVNATLIGDTRTATAMTKEDGLYVADLSIDEKGEQNVTVEAVDISGNREAINTSVNVSDEVEVDLQPVKDIFVRGERIRFDIETSDANGEQLEGYTANIDVDKNGTGTETVDGESDYMIADVEDPPTEKQDPNLVPAIYTAEATVDWNGNQITDSVEFPVTRLLDITWVEPDGSIEPGETFSVKTKWKRPDGTDIRPTSSVYSICSECDSEYRMMSTADDSDVYSQTFEAPNRTGEVTIQAFARNRWNSESQSDLDSPPTRVFDVGTSEDDEGSGNGGGFGGGGGAPPSLDIERLSPPAEIDSGEDVNLSLSTSMSAECRYSRNVIYESIRYGDAETFDTTNSTYHHADLDVSDGTYRYSVACDAGIANRSSEIVFSKGGEISGFNLFTPSTMTPGNETGYQSENITEPFTVLNNGTEELELQISVDSPCCEGWVTREDRILDEVVIEPGSEKRYVLKAYAPLYAEEGQHNLLLQFQGENSRQKSLSFQILDNREMRRFNELREKADNLRWRINNFESAGIQTGDMNETYQGLLMDLEDANESISSDDMESLQNATRKGYLKAERVDELLEESEFRKYILLNWWKWGLGFVLSYLAFFLVTIVAIPYYRLKTQLLSVNRRLKNAVEARKKSEKQYFRREIDKQTFNRMMRERQNQVLELRGEKEDLEDEKDNFWKNQITLNNYIRAPIKASEEVVKWWQANQEARQSLSDESEE